MKTSLEMLLVCWSSFALAFDNPFTAGELRLPQFLGRKHALASVLMRACDASPASLLRTANFQRYDPWREQITGLPADDVVGPIYVVDSNVVWGTVWAATYNAVIRTTNGGTTWICDTIKIAPLNLYIGSIFALDANRCWVTMNDTALGSSGSVFRTTDAGMTWSQDSIAFKTAGGYADFIHFFDANHGVCVGDPQNGYFEIYTSSNGGASWSRVPQSNIPSNLAQEFGQNLNYYSAAANSLWFPTVNYTGGTGRYYRTTDRGVTWSVHVYSGPSSGYVLKLAFQDDHIGLGCGGHGDLSRTTDGGLNWTQVSPSSYFQIFDYNFVDVPGAPGMFVGSAVWGYPTLQNGPIQGTTYTTDGGASWTWATSLPCTFFYMEFATASAGWRTQHNGSNVYKWTMAQGRVIGTSVDSLTFISLASGQKSDTIAIDAINFGSDTLTVSGIVAPGSQFTVVKEPVIPAMIPPLGSVKVKLWFSPSKYGVLQDSLVFVSNALNAPRATVYLHGTGTGTAGSVEQMGGIPKAFALLQNYPNPFNPATTIRYTLPHRTQVQLAVYNTLGQEVASLVNGDIDSGYHEVKFDGSTLASGVYFYRLQTGTFVDTKKLLLLR